jgi:hypothetical protein
LPKEIAMIHSFDLRIGALCAVCAQLLLVPPAFAGPITEITGRYSTVTPVNLTSFTLSGGMLDSPFSGATNDQIFDLSNPAYFQINGMGGDSKNPLKSVITLGATVYPDSPPDPQTDTHIFDIVNPAMRVNQAEFQVPLSFRFVEEGSTFQGQDITAVTDGILIFDLIGVTVGEDGQISYDSGELSATFSIVPEPTSLALVIPGLISLLGLRYLGRRRSQAG